MRQNIRPRATLMTIGAIVVMSADLWARQAPSVEAGAARAAVNATAARALRARGLELGYNLDHEDALGAFKQAIEADPADPAPYRLVAATAWIMLLFQQGAITVDDFLGQAQSNPPRPRATAPLDAVFHDYLGRALILSERRVRENPADADAHFQIGSAAGFQASYAATVEGRVLAGFRAARRAYNEHERVLELDPRRKDAGLIVGLYRYAVASLSAPMRLLAHLAGFGGGRERGLRMVEEAARYASDIQTNALFTLIVMYNREARYADALGVISQLQRLYPRNRLLWLESGSTALRAGRPAEARAALEEGLTKLSQDSRPRAFGEEARWRYYYGAALVTLEDLGAAERELRAALSGEAPDWVHGRAHNELGKLADLSSNRARAIEEYRLGDRLCRAHHDTDCMKEANALRKSRYR